MYASAPALDLQGSATPIGYHDFHPDVSLNFQCNRWLGWIGAEAIDEIALVARASNTYPEWISGFLGLADSARQQGRVMAASYYDRAAEFFMDPRDPRRTATRARFLQGMRETYRVTPELVPFQAGAALPAYDLRPDAKPVSTVVVFGGFDSYVEEFLPMLAAFVAAGHRVIAFDGPGQGGALEDAGLPLAAQWEHPVSAVLDHFGLDDVTAVGISLGGGLVIRAAAFEPRIRRAVAFDVLDDMTEATGRQFGPGAAPVLRALLALRARTLINALARFSAARKPGSEWGLRQGMHVTGTTTPYDFLRAARTWNTRHISGQLTADVLLLAGTQDHYVPLPQLHRQAANLTNARSVTTRVFTAADQASNHCQIGNFTLAIRTIIAWAESIQATTPNTSSAHHP